MMILALLSIASASTRIERRLDKGADALGRGEYEEALDQANWVLEREPANVQATFLQGAALLNLYPEYGYSVLNNAVRMAPAGHPLVPVTRDALRTFGALELMVERPVECSAEAVEAYQRAELFYGDGDYSSAGAWYEKALGLCPDNYKWRTYYGDVFFGRGQYNEALVQYRRALELEPCYWVALRFEGDALAQLGRTEEARERTAVAIGCNPSYTQAWVQLSDLQPLPFGAPLPKPFKAESEPGAELSVPPGVQAIFGSAAGKAWSETWQGTTGTPLEIERAAVRAAVAAAEASGRIDSPENALWKVMKRADERGLLDAAIFVIFLDEALIPEFQAYRAEHADELTRFVLELMVSDAPPPGRPEVAPDLKVLKPAG